MNRREIIAGLGSATAWPVVARSQQTAMPVIGWLSRQSADDDTNRTVPFLQGLKEAGYVEGQNVAVEYRYAENQFDRLPSLAADLVRRRVAVIGAPGGPEAMAAKASTATIPIVFVVGGDPVALALVASLNRPGANVTGSSSLAAKLETKRLQLLRELLPDASQFGVLADPAGLATQSTIADLQVGARTLGLQLVVASASTDRDLEPAFATFTQQHVGAVLVGPSAFYNRRTEQFAALAARHALPAIFPYREYALAGGLISYGTSIGYFYHQAGVYTGRFSRPWPSPLLLRCHLDDHGSKCNWPAHEAATYTRTGTAVPFIISELPGERAEALFIAMAALVPTAGEHFTSRPGHVARY